MKSFAASLAAAALAAVSLPSQASDFLRLGEASNPYHDAAPVSEIETGNPTSFFLRGGFSGLVMNESAKVSAAGLRVSGADVSIPPAYTFGFEAGLYLTPNWAVAVGGGFPPRVTVKGAGTIRNAGVLGSAVTGPVALMAQYHFTGLGQFQPYVGIGPTYMIVFSERDGAMTNAKVLPALGFAAQIGANYMFTPNWGVFADLKYAYLRTKARGYLGGAPVSADVTLDPFVFSTGITYKY